MTHQVALALGSFAIAYAPLLALFALIVYRKAQLVILVTTAAFFFLLSATASSMIWFLLAHVAGLDGPLAAIAPSVLCQFLARCAFVAVYHTVERVIRVSLQNQQHKEETDAALPQPHNNTNTTTTTNNNNNNMATPETHTTTNNNTITNNDSVRLHLELNDGSSAIAAAVGFGGMHAILLYGSLLASEITHNNMGILYQDSCPAVPSLAVSAVLTNFCSILQVFWMLLTFFGMRRRLLFHRGESSSSSVPGPSEDDIPCTNPSSRCRGSWLGNSRNGGNCALLWTLISHATAALATLANTQTNGCLVSLPVVGGTVLVTAYLFWAGCGRIYLPPAPSHED